MQSHYLKFNPRFLPQPISSPFPGLFFSLSAGAEKQTNTTNNKPTSLFVIPPQGVEDGPVGEDADQPILHGDVMEEGLLGVDDEGVGDPEQLH